MADSYIALDLETTGLNPRLDKIIEIGAVRVVDGKEQDAYVSFVNPGRLLEEDITELTGIENRDLENAPAITGLLPGFMAWMGDMPLLGHHIIFDYSFLKRAAVNMGIPFERNGIDTLTIARSCMPEAERKNLKQACLYFGVSEEPSHRALADARAAHQLFQKMKSLYAETALELFAEKRLVYQVKKEQPASKRQKEHLHELAKYHRISLTVQIDSLSRNEISRVTDKIIAQYGRI